MTREVNENSNASDPPEEHHLVTTRSARYFTVGAPVAGTSTVWFALHGYAQLAERFLRPFQDVVPVGTMVVAPEALSRFYLELPRADRGHMARVGAAWMTKEDRLREIADAVAWLDVTYRDVMDRVVLATGREPMVGVLAFSQGVATAMRWIAGGRPAPARVVMWAGSVADDVNISALQHALRDSEVVLVAGTSDSFMTEKARRTLIAQWAAMGIQVREVQYEGGHELESTTLEALLEINRP